MAMEIFRDISDSDYSHWKDTGCDLADSCLSCPFANCKYDNYSWYESYKRLAKHQPLIKSLIDWQSDQYGLLADQMRILSVRYNVTNRTIFRVKKKFFMGGMDFDILTIFYERLWKEERTDGRI